MLTGLRAAFVRFVGRPVLRWASSSYPGAAINFELRAGDPRQNSAVEAVLGWISRNFPEAPVEVLKEQGGDMVPIVGHPMVRLIERPNPYFSGVLMWTATVLSFLALGNAYWRKIRNANGVPVELWWIPNTWITPKWSDSGTEYIGWYEYQPDSNMPKERIDPADIVHFRDGIDPDNIRQGRSRLYSLMREVFTDNEASNYTAVLLKNLGVPGLIIAPTQPDTEVDEVAISNAVQEKFSGDGRGRAMTLSAPASVTVVSFSPKDMDLRSLRRIPEERVSGVFGVAAIVAGLGAGLDRSTFANFAEARQAAYEECIIPLQRILAAELEVQLLPDFHQQAALASLDVKFDLSGVRVLGDDEDALLKRVDLAVSHGWLTVAAGKRQVGFEVLDGDDVYLRSFSQTAVPSSQPTLVQPRPATKALRAAPDHKERVNRLVGGLLEDDLAAYFAGFADRIEPAVRAEWTPGAINWSVEEAQMLDILKRAYGRVGEEVFRAISAEFGVTLAFGDPNSPSTDAVAEVLGAKVVGIMEATRTELSSLVDLATQRGYTTSQTVRGVPEEGFVGLRGRIQEWGDLRGSTDARAVTIARTELAHSYNLSSALGWRESGIRQVAVFDGREDPGCAEASGATWDIEQAVMNPIEHPNCIRAFTPVFPSA